MSEIHKSESSLSIDGRYRLLVEAITDYAIYMLSPQGIITSWNPGARRFKGYDADEIIGQHFSCFYSPEDQAAGIPTKALETARREGNFEAEGWRIRKDGSRFWAYVVIDPIIDQSSHELVGFAKITRDLTERRLAEETLRKSEEQFRLLVKGVTDYAIYLLDPTGRITNWNLGAERIKGYTPEEIIGEHFSRFYTEGDLATDEPLKALEAAHRDGRFEKEGWRQRKDGSKFFAHVIIDAIYNDDGDLLGFAKITRDITERRIAQEELERTRDALFQSQKLEAIGQLTGGVAHDFNNLLMAVLGSLEIAKRRLAGTDEKVLDLIDNAIQGAKRGASLTQRMLAFARKQEIKAEPTDLVSLVHGMSELLGSSLGRSIAIETRFPLAIRRVMVDANQLEMAILNLALNARDAMPNGGSLVISAKEEVVAGLDTLKAGQYVCLALTDTGTGMDEITLQRALEPFFTTKGVGKGTGLGLSMVHGIAMQFGGGLNLKSEIGRGTAAEMWLPITETPAAAPHAPSTLQVERRREPLVILTVDDDALVLTNTTAMLEEIGHHPIAVSSGPGALEIISDRHEEIDLVITDHVMPEMTGAQFAAIVRKSWPDIPIIIATGYADEKGIGSWPRLAKPFTLSQLQKYLETVVQRRHSRGLLLQFPSNGSSAH